MEQPKRDEGQTKPSIVVTHFIKRTIEKEKIAKWLKLDIQNLCDAYLALREEHKSNVEMWQNIVNKLQKTCEEADAEIEQLKVENQGLRALCENLEIGIPTPFSYTTDYATGDTDAEGGQP